VYVVIRDVNCIIMYQRKYLKIIFINNIHKFLTQIYVVIFTTTYLETKGSSSGYIFNVTIKKL